MLSDEILIKTLWLLQKRNQTKKVMILVGKITSRLVQKRKTEKKYQIASQRIAKNHNQLFKTVYDFNSL